MLSDVTAISLIPRSFSMQQRWEKLWYYQQLAPNFQKYTVVLPDNQPIPEGDWSALTLITNEKQLVKPLFAASLPAQLKGAARYLIHAEGIDMLHEARYLRHFLGGIALLSVENPPSLSKIGRFLALKSLPTVKAHLVFNDVTRSALRDMGVPPEKLHLLPPYINTAVFMPSPLLQQAEKLAVLVIDSLQQVKYVSAVLQAVQGLQNVHVTILGEGRALNSLEMQADILGVHAQFITDPLTDEQQTMYLQSSDVVIVPSPAPNTLALLKGMACALPVITSDIAEHKAIITHSIDGLCVPLLPLPIKQAIQQLQQSDNIRLGMGAAALESVRTKFALEKRLAQERELLHGLL